MPNAYGILPVDNGTSSYEGNGYTPQQLRAAYDVNNILFGDVQGNGAGQTIAIVDADNNPDLVDTGSPGFATSDLGVYDSTFHLPDPPSFKVVGQDGGPRPTATDPNGGWESEEAADVEMVHSMAPMANIILVEGGNDLLSADEYAATVAPVVSNSWGYGADGEILGSDETLDDVDFQTPGVTFLFSTGDYGASGGYPADSPDVVAVGGTTLYLAPNSGSAVESAWATENLLGGYGHGGGGGTSLYEPEPSYQDNVQSTGQRTIPDVSAVANANYGVAVYDAFNGGWFEYGGTSVACPLWAGLVGVADQGRQLMNNGTPDPLTGYNQTLPALYSLPYTDFNDITVGNNQDISVVDAHYGNTNAGYRAGPGYDEVTGLGSPRAGLLVPDLAGYGLATQLAVTTQPPANMIAGDPFGLTVTVEDAVGNIDSSYNGSVSLTLVSGPAGASYSGSVTAKNGVAVFDGLNFSEIGSNYQVEATAAGVSNVDSDIFSVVTNPTPLAGSYYPATSDASLRAAIDAADADGFASDTIYLEAGIYTLTNSSLGELVLQNTGGPVSKTITIVGQGPGQTTIEPSTNTGFGSRDFEVIDAIAAQLTVVFQDLTIAGGQADGGADEQGGGVLIDGGTVEMSGVVVGGNQAVGRTGTAAGPAPTGQSGAVGGGGGSAQGGGIYLETGNLTLNHTLFGGNIAWGGKGGTGGAGGWGTSSHLPGFAGGSGGAGGAASGGGLYVAGGNASGSFFMSGNVVFAGSGGSGGRGGIGIGKNGDGGAGGPGGAREWRRPVRRGRNCPVRPELHRRGVRRGWRRRMGRGPRLQYVFRCAQSDAYRRSGRPGRPRARVRRVPPGRHPVHDQWQHRLEPGPRR